MKKKLAAARRRIENGDGAKGGEEEEEVPDCLTSLRVVDEEDESHVMLATIRSSLPS